MTKPLIRAVSFCLPLLVVIASGYDGPAASRAAAPGDTLMEIRPPGGIPNYASRDTFLVVGKRVTLREIIRRAVQGERGKLGGHDNMTYTMTGRSIVTWEKKRKVHDTVMRAYADARGNHRLIVLEEKTTNFKRENDEWVLDEDNDDDSPAPVRISTEGVEDFTRIPFFLEDEHEFEFALLDRSLEEDRVIFKIAFRPKSDFKPLPSGVVYVDTKHYRIVHEEFHFDKNPFPLFLKGVDRISRHWEVLPGGACVFTKMLMEAKLRADPFGYIPHTVTAAVVRDDFRFDQGYDERLFGPLDDPPEPAAVVDDDDVDSEPDQFGELVQRLQSDDLAFYPRRLLEGNPVLRDHAISQHDSLGLAGLEELVDRRLYLLEPHAGLAGSLLDYNRVEGLVVGPSISLRNNRDDSPRISLQAAYATGSRKVRHSEEITLPLTSGGWRTELELGYTDRVVPYGSNRPVGNGLRMLLGGEDKQDYLRREGGRANFSLRHRSGLSLGAAYEIADVHSVEGTTDFSFSGEMRKFNAPIDEGIESAVVAEIGWRSAGRRLTVGAEQRFAGGALGGDFEYARSDASLDWRRYLVGRHELSTELHYTLTSGGAPVQQLADVGGLSTVRGYPRRTLVGESSLTARVEYLLPYDILGDLHIPLVSAMGLQLVPWADAGRVWDGNSERWIHSVGFGLQLFLGVFDRASNLRLDFAFPTGENAPDDFRLELHFAPGEF